MCVYVHTCIEHIFIQTHRTHTLHMQRIHTYTHKKVFTYTGSILGLLTPVGHPQTQQLELTKIETTHQNKS